MGFFSKKAPVVEKSLEKAAEKFVEKKQDVIYSEESLPHLYYNKSDFENLLRDRPIKDHAALSDKYGWYIVYISCNCGNQINGHVIDRRSSVEDDLRTRPCGRCGARGQWKSVNKI